MPGQHPRELNPYWKDGGSGLPSTSSHKRDKMEGRSWLLRSYKRALEQAKEKKINFEEIAVKQWGSLEKIHSLLRSVGIDPQDPDSRVSGSKKQYLYSRSKYDEEQYHRQRRKRDEERTRKPWSTNEEQHHHQRRKGDDEERKPWSTDEDQRHHQKRKGDEERTRKPWSTDEEQRHHQRRKGDDEERKPWSTDEEQRHHQRRKGDEERTDKSCSSRRSKSFLCPSDDFSMPADDVDSYKCNWKKQSETSDVVKETFEEVSLEKDECPQVEVSNEKVSLDEYITDSMINSKSAKLIKAELMGNKGKIVKLKEELQSLRTKKKSQDLRKATEPASNSREKTVLLVTTDRFGQVRPADLPAQPVHKSRGKSKKSYHSVVDDDCSMKALVEMERKMTAEDTHLAIAKMASKFVRSTDDDVVDDVVDIKVKTDPLKDQERQRNAVLLQSRRMEEMLDNCRLCINSSRHKQHLVVAIGLNTYLAVPSQQSLVVDHCMIVPIEHTACSLQMDENVWSEVKIFQKGLTKMFSDHDKDVVFSECFSNPGRKAHMHIDCIPLEKQEGSLAPMYFKKAILESDSEWAQNKRLIDTRQKSLRSSVPLGLPYFFVDFNNEGGFAHVIEDSLLFPHYFAKEVIGGLVDARPVLWLKPPLENFESQVKKALHLKEMWSPYDWTKQLRE